MIVEMPRIVILPGVKEGDEPILRCAASEYDTDWTECGSPSSVLVVYHNDDIYHTRMIAYFCEQHRHSARQFVDSLLNSVSRRVEAECKEVYDSSYFRALSNDKMWKRVANGS